jgi:hypothetical protein
VHTTREPDRDDAEHEPRKRASGGADEESPPKWLERGGSVPRNEDHSRLQRRHEPNARPAVVAYLEGTELNARDAESGCVSDDDMRELVHQYGHDEPDEDGAEREREQGELCGDARIHDINAVGRERRGGRRTRSTAGSACWPQC